MTVVDLFDIDLVHETLGLFFGRGGSPDLDVHGDLVFVPGADHHIAKGIVYFQLVLSRNGVGFIDRLFLFYLIVAVFLRLTEQRAGRGSDITDRIAGINSFICFFIRFFF